MDADDILGAHEANIGIAPRRRNPGASSSPGGSSLMSGSLSGSSMTPDPRATTHGEGLMYRDLTVPLSDFMLRIKKFEPDHEFVRKVVKTADLEKMKKMFSDNYTKIAAHDYLMDILTEMIKYYGPPGMYLRGITNVQLVVSELARILDDSQKKWALFDVDMRSLGLLRGSRLDTLLEKSTEKLSQILLATEKKVLEYHDERIFHQDEKMALEATIAGLREELEQAKQRIRQLKGENIHLDIPSEQQFMEDLNLNLSMYEYMSSSLQQENYELKKSNKQYLEEIMIANNQMFEQHAQNLKEIAEYCKDLELEEGIRKELMKYLDTYADDPPSLVGAVNRWMKEINIAIEGKRDTITEMSKQTKELDDEIAARQVEISELEHRRDQLNDAAAALREEVGEPSRSWRPRHRPKFVKSIIKKFSRKPDSSDTPEVPRGRSPDYEAYELEEYPTSFRSTPKGSPYSSPSPLSFDEPIAPWPSMGQTVGAGTQTLSHSGSEFAPSIRPIDPSTQTFVKIPEAGPSHRIDSPLNERHRAELTPHQYVTPFISKSRFGYTDPTARVLNIPPGAEFDVPTGMRGTVVLTSPKRKEPLLVDIDVDPKPLTQTASGEHFVCDISLAVQQANKRRYVPDRVRFRHLSPVFTYGEPPEVTPTSDRRHGLFTPRGIFQRKHFNVRRVHRPHEYQSPELPWSPHDLPDARSPVSGLYPSPDISDSSIPWAMGPESPYSPLNRTFDAPPRAPLNRTFEKSHSPLIKGPYYGRETPESDVYSSPSPVIERPSHRRYRSPESESPSPIIKGPSYMRRSYGRDRLFDRSPSPPMSRTFDMSSPAPDFNRTFGSHEKTYDSHQRASPYSTDSRSISPKYGSIFGRSYDAKSPQLSKTFDRSHSPRMNQTYSRSPSPRMDQTYSRSPSPRMDQTYSRSPSPRMDQTYSRSLSPRMNQTFNETPSPELEESHEESPLNMKFYGEENAPELNTTY